MYISLISNEWIICSFHVLKESFRPRIFLNAQLFLSGYCYRPHVSVEHGI